MPNTKSSDIRYKVLVRSLRKGGVKKELEREYIFLRALYPRLQYTKETLPMEILDRVDLNKLRLQMVMDGTIELEAEDADLQSSRIGDVNTPAEDEKKTLREILDIVNEPYRGFLEDHLLCNERLSELDFRAHFNTLVGKYEPFLKKLYYPINNRELTTRDGAADRTQFADCIFGHESLRWLKHTLDKRYFRFRDYLDKVRTWRNEEAHSAPEFADEELKAAIHIFVTMYAYVTARSITDLEKINF